jgi:transcriptional regulator with XRE-family HTH domain
MDRMDAAIVLRQARAEVGLTLRELASRAGTAHSTLAAYEGGNNVPSVETLDRIVRAAGFELDAVLQRRWRQTNELDRGAELVAVLELAAQFPARHDPELRYPVFGQPVFGA